MSSVRQGWPILASAGLVLVTYVPYLVDALSGKGFPEGYELPIVTAMLALGVLLLHLLGERGGRARRVPYILVLAGGAFLLSVLGVKIPVFAVPALAIGVLLWWSLERKDLV